MPEERIQKVLATAGVASRRAAEVLVATGRVRVDGKVAVVGQKVDPVLSTIEVDGNPVGVGVARAYVALHKPGGVTSTTRDRHADTTVLDLIPTTLVPDGTRLYPVGRLDQDSEGLLLLTNDGEWAERVLHPRFGIEREYAVALATPLIAEQARLLNAGIRIEEGMAKLTTPLRATTSVENRVLAETLDPAPDPNLVWYRATLAQGWKRQLRRMFGAVDAPIVRLVRVRIGIVRLGDLRSGRSRNLKAPEVKAMAGLATSAAGRPSTRDASGGAPPPQAPSRPAVVRPHKGRPQGPRTPVGKPSAGKPSAGKSWSGAAPDRPRTSRQRET
ncbi:MAG: rRNA synthase [Chloroflexota bacterium]|jgi:23S rRNA pseudouridine2605 synthase|nr:rRNA synthase [Chloroflexota bacterium]